MKVSGINFKGFNNIICTDNTVAGNKRITYLSFQLNDEGINDLSSFKYLQTMHGYFGDKKPTDTVTFSYVTDIGNKWDSMYIYHKPLLLGEELRKIEDKYIPKFISEDNYKKIKAVHMRAYTLLASITKRLANKNLDFEDIGRMNVMKETFENLKNMTYIKSSEKLFTEQEAFNLLETGCLKQFKFQEVASKFNKAIIATMEHYFK